MTLAQAEKFKREYKSIVYKYSEISDNTKYLKTLHAYDKNGSHENAILKALDSRKELQDKLKEMLKGLSYEDWKFTSQRLSRLTSKLKNADLKREKAVMEFDKLSFNI